MVGKESDAANMGTEGGAANLGTEGGAANMGTDPWSGFSTWAGTVPGSWLAVAVTVPDAFWAPSGFPNRFDDREKG